MSRLEPGKSLTTQFAVTCVTPGKAHFAVMAILAYVTADPYAVHVELAGPRANARWVLSREMLTAGLAAPCGVGDVKIRPYAGDSGIFHLTLAAAGDGLASEFWVPRPQTAAFLRQTYDMVPWDRESDFVDMDAELDDLLRGDTL